MCFWLAFLFKITTKMTKMMKSKVVRPGRGVTPPKTEAQDLETIIKDCVQTKASWGLVQNDLMFAVAFWSMVENGFESQGKPATSLPKNWKHQTKPLYEASFIFPPYKEHPVKLFALPADDILCINVLVSNISPRNINLRSLAVHTTGYVLRKRSWSTKVWVIIQGFDRPYDTLHCDVPLFGKQCSKENAKDNDKNYCGAEDDTIRYKFSGLDRFYSLLRETIIWPIRCSILTEQGIINGSLCGLSDEIKLNIVRHLNAKEVLLLSQTCHDLNRICNDQELWKTIFHESFKSSCKCATNSQDCDERPDWKESFKQKYAERQTKGGGAQESPSDSFHTALDVPFGSEIGFDVD